MRAAPDNRIGRVGGRATVKLGVKDRARVSVMARVSIKVEHKLPLRSRLGSRTGLNALKAEVGSRIA